MENIFNWKVDTTGNKLNVTDICKIRPISLWTSRRNSGEEHEHQTFMISELCNLKGKPSLN
ncbi:hypothetical protein PR048_011306 [Dryococelus australis]|uniref:Uncharacterized protein n=1 Tax=Dryococelus australis TaxID=614101 RepID=A0ABQ9HLE5_9NEOP|nr:hypothetical protein PR048_011306 [Dryococelus australis]